MSKLRRFWFEFDIPQSSSPAGGGITLDGGSIAERYLGRGCGVTAMNEDEARSIIQTQLLGGADLPPVRRVIADVDVSRLPPKITTPTGNRPSYGVPVWRGIWFPRVTEP